ncbi:MAG: site-specific integrase [Bacillota bacterium]|nr:site-specific integrase [Bacillota bacterium]
MRGYEIAQRRITETLGDPKAEDVTAYMIDKWIIDITDQLSPKTIKNTVSFLSTCFKKGMRWGIVTANPCSGAELPTKEHKEKVTLELKDIAPFYEALHKEEDYDFIVAVELALFCGLRRSEIFGLTNSSIDTTKAVLTVRQTRHRINGKDIVQSPKTKTSERTLALPDFLVKDIIELHNEHEREKQKHKVISFSDYLILNGFGEPPCPDHLWTLLKRFEDKNHLPNVSPHGLRHTYASMVNYFGRDLVEISNQLGHANKTITLDTYTHLFEDVSHVSKEIASEVNDFIRKA